MKKTNKIIIIGAIALVFILSVGYALFSDNLNISGTAKAEGALNLELTNPQLADNSGDSSMIDETYVSYSIDGTKITFEATLLVPGKLYTFMANIENHGTVDARLNSITANPQFNRDNVCDLTSYFDEACSLFKDVYYDENNGAFFLAAVTDSNMNINSTNTIIPAGDSSGNYVINVLIGWDESWNTAITEPQTVNFTVDFGFVQDN